MLHQNFSPKWKGRKAIMKKYTFGVWLDIDAENENEAIYFFDSIVKNNALVSDSYCFEWKEVE